MFAAQILSILPLAAVVVGQKCGLQFDGRIPANTNLTDLDSNNGIFGPDFVHGANLTFSQLVKFPDVPPSLFDAAHSTKALEVTISDKSIFAPSPNNIQTGFRRAELTPASNNGSDPSTTGIKTLHLSLRADNARPLNFSHEYALFFLEAKDFSTDQLTLGTGTVLGPNKTPNPELLFVQSNAKSATNLFTTLFSKDVWHNFAFTMDFTKNTVQVFYSQDSQPLVAVTQPLANDISGQGQFHFGMLKKPTGDGLTDITKQGFQPSGIDEGVIYGGIFEESTDCGCISLAP